MPINNSQRAIFPNELSATMTGSPELIGTLLYNPVILIFDNQSTVEVSISINDDTGSNIWKTFSAGEAVLLDLRCQQGKAPNFTVDLGTAFYGIGASGDFKISYVAAKETS
jgi:hypothetical protein